MLSSLWTVKNALEHSQSSVSMQLVWNKQNKENTQNKANKNQTKLNQTKQERRKRILWKQ